MTSHLPPNLQVHTVNRDTQGQQSGTRVRLAKPVEAI
jgi:hypothetical protein